MEIDGDVAEQTLWKVLGDIFTNILVIGELSQQPKPLRCNCLHVR